MSQITTHILDTSLGKPAADVAVALYQENDQNWKEIGKGSTNADGRITNLLSDDSVLSAGTYKMRFATQPYFNDLGINAFYPFVEIAFRITGDGQHYHVPLLLNPFGYSTYRGS